jgi:hypothetical protein
MKKPTVHTVTFDDDMQLSEDQIKLYSGIFERSDIKIEAKHEMKTVGTIKGKKKFTLEEWKKEADAARKRAIYWKKQSDQWEGRFFLVQDSIGGEVEAIAKKLESTETQLRWAYDANKELKASNIDLKGANDELAADGSKYRLDIKLLQEDLDIEKHFNERLQDDHNVLKNIQRHTALLGWAGWILFFVTLFGMIFFKN